MVAIYSLLLTLFCVALQVMFFNHLHLWGGVALIYVYALIKLPVDFPRWSQILIGFLAGLSVDVFSNTPGMHALVGCTMMWMRLPVLHLFVVADEAKSGTPGLKMLGVPVFLRLALTMIALYCFLLYFVESFTLFNFGAMLLKIVMSFVMTTLLTLVLEFAGKR